MNGGKSYKLDASYVKFESNRAYGPGEAGGGAVKLHETRAVFYRCDFR